MAVTTTNSHVTEGVLVLSLPENAGSGTVVTVIGTDVDGETIDRVYLYGTHRTLFEVNADNELVFKGTAQDFESMPAGFSLSLQVVTLDGETGRPTTHVLKNVVVKVSDVDEAPTGLAVTNVVTELKEGDVADAVKVADIAVADDALGMNTLTELPADSSFEYRAATRTGAELWLKAGTTLDRETLDTLVAAIAVDGTGLTATYTLTVLDTNDNAPMISRAGTPVTLGEGLFAVDTDTGIRLSTTDADLNDTVTLSVNDARFKVRESDGALLVAAGTELDHESLNYGVVAMLVEAVDSGGNRSERTVLVHVADRNDTDPVFNGSGNVAIDENSGAAQVLYDPDVTADINGDTVTHSLSGPDAGSFTIDARTGELTLTGDPDYEAKPVYIVTIRAVTREGQPDERSASQHVVVRVNDGNDLPPHIEPTAVAEIAEGSGAGQVVHTPVAAVPDVAGDTVTYRLGGTDAAAFRIDDKTGALTLVGDPDFEEQPFYTVTITAVTRAGKADEQTAYQTFTLLVEDRPGDELALVTDGTPNTLAEGEYTAGTDTGVTLSIKGRADLAGISFQLDDKRFEVEADGTLSVVAGAVFDHETEADRLITLTVKASDGQGSRGETTLTVAVSNVNDVAPEITSTETGAALPENTEVAAGQAIYQAAGTFDATVIAWRIRDGDAALFEIDTSTGEVTAKAALTPNHEKKTGYSFTLVADSGGLVDKATVTLPVVDLNDTGPRFTSPAVRIKEYHVKENIGANHVIERLEATPDVDGDTVTFKLSGKHAEHFEVDQRTGAVTLVPDPDHETLKRYELVVHAVTRDGQTDEQRSTLWTLVHIRNLDDNAPVIARSGSQAELPEGEFAQAVPTGYTFTATDADKLGGLIFTIDHASFEVLSDGRLVVKAGSELDYEALTEGKVAVRVDVTDGAGHTDSDALTILITDVDDDPLTITSPETAAEIAENTALAATDTVYTATGSAPGGASISWSLKGDDAGLLDIGASSGQVKFRTATTPDHEGQASYAFTVVATSGEHTEELTVTLPVADLNDHAPAFAATGSATVAEATGAGRTVYTPVAAVPDVDEDPVTYELSGADKGHFTIDSDTGALTLTTNPDFETKSSYSVKIIAVTRDGMDDEQSSEQKVTITVTDTVGLAPVLTRSGSQSALAEGTFAAETPTGYSYTATDADIGDTATFSVSDERFLIDASGRLAIGKGSVFDHEGGDASVSVTVEVADSEGNTDSDTVAVVFTDINDVHPVITSGKRATARPENTAVDMGTALYTAAGTYDTETIAWSITDGDSNRLRIDAKTGVVTFAKATTPDHESKSAYTFTLVADSDGLRMIGSVVIPVTDLNDNRPAFAATGSARVKDGGGANQQVYTPVAAVPDVRGDTVVYKLSGADAGDFTINPKTGALTLVENPDFGQQPQYVVTISAVTRDGRSDWQSSDQTVTVMVYEGTSPVLTQSGAPATLYEGTFADQTPTGYTYTATDADGDALTFTVSDNRFVLTPDGKLAIAAGRSFDADDKDTTVSVTVTVKDGDGDTDSDTVIIKFTDINDKNPEITSSKEGTKLPENTEVGTGQTVYTATGTFDVTPIKWSIAGGDSGDLIIDGATGEVKFRKATTPDHETKSEYTFTLTANSGVLSDSKDVTIPVNDLNEKPTLKPSTGTLSVDEGRYPKDTLTAHVFEVEDEDIGDTHTFGTDDSRFKVSESDGKLLLTIVAGAEFDHEKPEHSVKVAVTVTDSGVLSDSGTVTVTINDTNDEDPAFAESGSASVNDGEGGNQKVYTPEAAVPDVDGDTVVYQLSGTDAGEFDFDSTTGALTLEDNANHGEKPSYEVIITAVTRDGTDEMRSTDQKVTITVVPRPVITSEDNKEIGDENTLIPKDTLVYTATGTHPSPIAWSLEGADEARFTIDSKSGEVRINADTVPDFEDDPSYVFSVVASVPGFQPVKKKVTLTIGNVNERPTVKNPIRNMVTDEDKPWTFVVPASTFEDPDGDVLYFSATVPDWLDFHAETRTLSGTPDADDVGKHDITITASDAPTGGLSVPEKFELTVNPIYDPRGIQLNPNQRQIQEQTWEDGNGGRLKSDLDAAKIVITGFEKGAYSLALSGEHSAFFKIVGDGLVLQAGTLLDHEQTAELNVTVSIIGENLSASHTVTVINVPETLLVISGDAAASITENDKDSVGAVVYIAKARVEYKDKTVTWSIVSNFGDWNSFSINPANGEVTFSAKNPADYETKSTYTFKVQASAGTEEASKEVTLTVIDQYDTEPRFPTPEGSFSVDENATGSDLKFALPSAVPDLAVDKVTYEVVPNSDSDAFSLGLVGEKPTLTLKQSPDHESQTSYTVGIKAFTRKGTSDEKSSIFTATINVNDTNDHGPFLHTRFGAFSGYSDQESPVHTENGWSRMVTMTGTPDVAGDTIVWSLVGGDTSRIKVTEDGEVWLRTSDLYIDLFNIFTGRVTAKVGKESTQANLFLVYGKETVQHGEESPEEAQGDEDDSDNSGDDEGNGKGEEDTPDSAPSFFFGLDDGYF